MDNRSIYPASDGAYDHAVLDHLFPMHRKPQPASDSPPQQPQKNPLRASRLMKELTMKLDSSIEASELSKPVPHDMYLSSEEDVSSSADDFSEYDYDLDSTSEASQSPTRESYEVTARAVTVVFAGKPSLIDLSARPRKSATPRSLDLGKRSSTFSTHSSFSSLHQPTRTSDVSSFMSSSSSSKKKPHFLNIDPYANGSSYSLDIPRERDHDLPPAKSPVTPSSLFRGATRTLSLVRKRSRSSMIGNPSAANPPNNQTYPARPPSRRLPSTVEQVREEEESSRPPRQQQQRHQQHQPPPSPPSPVTYNDILRAAKKNSMIAPPLPSPNNAAQLPRSPSFPFPGPKRGILNGLAGRRRSIKLTGVSI